MKPVVSPFLVAVARKDPPLQRGGRGRKQRRRRERKQPSRRRKRSKGANGPTRASFVIA